MTIPPVIENESERLQVLQRYEVMDTDSEEGFDRITRLAAAYFDVPIALVSLVDQARQWFKSKHGLEVSETPRNISFCAHAIANQKTLIVPDALIDERFSDSPLVQGAPDIRFYAGAPLTTSDGFNLGTVCVIDTVPRLFSDKQKLILEDLSGLVMDQLELRLAKIKAEEELNRRKEYIETLRDSKTRLNAVFNSVLDAILILNDKGVIESHNRAAELLFGYATSELIGLHARSLMPDSFDLHAKAYFSAYKNTGQDKILLGSEQHIFGIRRDGSKFPAELSLSEMRLEDDRHYTVIIRDVTEHNRSERALLNAIANAEKANQAKSYFLSRVTHELRTPLNAIIGFGELLKMDLEPVISTDQVDYIDRILNGGKHLTSLINEILQVTKFETGSQNLSVEQVDLNSAILECWELVKPSAAERKIKFMFAQGKDENYAVQADLQRLKLVLVNLFSNAINYNSDAGSINVSITRQQENEVRLTITDTGPGISIENQEKIFEVFERLKEHEYGITGSGIGLALSKAIVVSMGGRMGVDSVVNKGSSFWLVLNLDNTIKEIQKSTPIKEPELADTMPVSSKSRFKVLHIEDNSSNLKLVESILARRDDIELITTTRGELGFVLALQNVPDLILLDAHLPDTDGFNIMEKLRANAKTAQIPIVVVSADVTSQQIEKYEKSGVDAYITKPIKVVQFLETVNRFLGSHRDG